MGCEKDKVGKDEGDDNVVEVPGRLLRQVGH